MTAPASNQYMVFDYEDGSTAEIDGDLAIERGLFDCPTHVISPEGEPFCVGTTVPNGHTIGRYQEPEQHQGALTSAQAEQPFSDMLGSSEPMAGGISPIPIIGACVLGLGYAAYHFYMQRKAPRE